MGIRLPYVKFEKLTTPCKTQYKMRVLTFCTLAASPVNCTDNAPTEFLSSSNQPISCRIIAAKVNELLKEQKKTIY